MKLLKTEDVQTPEPRPVDVAPEENFEVEVSDFKFVSRGMKHGKALRFTVTWKFQHPQLGLLGESEEGWLCSRNGQGDLRVSPPISKWGPHHSKQLKLITSDYHNLILGLITSYRTSRGTGYADYIGDVVPESLKAQRAQDVDPELPEEITS